MGQRVCPWWIGMMLVSPIRRWLEDPEKLLRPYIREGVTILEPGPGMGFFTLPMARMVGETGRVIAVDLQAKMLEGLRRRAERAGLLARIDLRQVQRDSLGVDDLQGKIDLVVAIHVVHEMPSDEVFFREAAESLKPAGILLLVEPLGHVNQTKFNHEIQSAQDAGLVKSDRRIDARGGAALFFKAA
jgi:2-polyprenyl-3-methyl-5-hydroxy-6-metoxy-1,4-benzoquinol methylase